MLRVPPLAGITSYTEAGRVGLSVDQTVTLLKRYAYLERRLMEIATSHICATPEWEVKCALSLHCWLDAEHATRFRERIAEMREPPFQLDRIPDQHLAAFLDEVLQAQDTVELLSGLYRVAKPALVRALRRHMAALNPLADYPTYRQLRAILSEEEEAITWGQAALAALAQEPAVLEHATAWTEHLNAYLQAAGGIWGDEAPGVGGLPPARAATPFVVDPLPRRDDRFSGLWEVRVDRFVDLVALDEQRSSYERTLALMYKRLREMNVPEMLGPIIARTAGKPWEYYREMTRQLWDEARHAMMGEVAFENLGVDWTALSIPVDWSYVMNTRLTPLESHAVLYSIEQYLMHRQTGKRAEWEVALSSGIPLAQTLQDYDWADEVLHTQIGRRWLLPDLGDRGKAEEVAAIAAQKMEAAYHSDPLLEQVPPTPWWPQFFQEVQARQGAAQSQALST
jgi:hypothetical protein